MRQDHTILIASTAHCIPNKISIIHYQKRLPVGGGGPESETYPNR